MFKNMQFMQWKGQDDCLNKDIEDRIIDQNIESLK